MRQANADRSVRNLGVLKKTASTSRVLNLAAIANSQKTDPDFYDKPFFMTPVVNECIILKHRIRMDERYVFDEERQNSTKIIIPFERSDLRIGGRSFFVGQRGWRDIVREIAGDSADVERDLRVLTIVDEIPSLDPFLLREHLGRRGIEIASCYFAISEADLARMQDFVASEINNLIRLTDVSAVGSSYSSKLVRVLLSPVQGESIQPIRLALRLDPDDFEDGIFAWKGFLYYQWVLSALRPQLAPILREILTMKVSSFRDREMERMLNAARRRLADRVNVVLEEAAGGIQAYEAAFNDLTRNGKPLTFSNFLRRTPEMFVLLGERIGALSHVATYWRFRFRQGVVGKIPTEELLEIVRDFERNLGHEGGS
jgi:hypothetical protein